MNELLWHVLYFNKAIFFKKAKQNILIGSFAKKQVGSEFKADPLVSFFRGKSRGMFFPLPGT